MDHIDDRLSLIKVAQENGVKDLPLKVRGPFAKAIIAERKGDHDTAERELNKAINAEN